MKLDISLALFLLAIACSSSGGDTGKGQGGSGGSGAQSSGGSSGSSAGGSGGFSLGGTAGNTSECVGDGDCTASSFDEPIASEADCYCLNCPIYALSKSEHDQRTAAWKTFCASWAKIQPCPGVDCSQPPPVFCQSGKCAFP